MSTLECEEGNQSIINRMVDRGKGERMMPSDLGREQQERSEGKKRLDSREGDGVGRKEGGGQVKRKGGRKGEEGRKG